MQMKRSTVFRHHARKLVLALALLAVATSLVPGSHVASAAPIPASAVVSDVQMDTSQTSGNWTMDFNKMVITPMNVVHQPNRQVIYYFKVKAEKGNLSDITIWLTSHYRNIAGNGDAGFSDNKVVHVDQLNEGAYTIVTVTCTPPAGKYCHFAYATGTSPNLLGGASAVNPILGKLS
jgi:hypothetical protein